MPDDWLTPLLVTASFVAGMRAQKRLASLARFKSSQHIPQEMIERQGVMHGICIRVPDGDGFRMIHTLSDGIPLAGLWTSLRSWLLRSGLWRYRKPELKKSLSIRIAGMDAPESAAFGMPAQPFALEARQHLERLMLNKAVRIVPLKRDQYQRVVATVYCGPVIKRNIGLEMVRKGLAVVYTSSGAVYGTDELRRQFEAAECNAKRDRIGLWSQEEVVLPGDHKKEHL